MITRFSVELYNDLLFADFEARVKKLNPDVTLTRVKSECSGKKVNYCLETNNTLDILLVGMSLCTLYNDDLKGSNSNRSCI